VILAVLWTIITGLLGVVLTAVVQRLYTWLRRRRPR